VRKGTVSDWRDLDPAMLALNSGKISYTRFAELGRMWLAGASADDLEELLPQSQATQIVQLVTKSPGLLTGEISKTLGLEPIRVAQLCHRLRKQRRVRTVISEKDHRQLKVYPT
jgi:hypothetical protein